MPFKLNRNKKKDHVDPPDIQAALRQDLVEQGAIPAEGQSAGDPTAEPILESSSETVVTASVEEEVSAASQSEIPRAEQVIEQEIVARGEELIIERVLIETCEAAVVGPPEEVAAAALKKAAASAPGTAVAVVKQGKEVVAKKPIISDRMRKTWGRSVKDPEKKANLLLPGVSPDFAGDMVITVVVANNPKLPGKGPWFRFAKYRTGMTVAEYIKACERVSPSVKVSHADLKWDVNHGYIRVSAAEELSPSAAQEQAA